MGENKNPQEPDYVKTYREVPGYKFTRYPDSTVHAIKDLAAGRSEIVATAETRGIETHVDGPVPLIVILRLLHLHNQKEFEYVTDPEPEFMGIPPF
jgi:hypothetical protein